MLIVGEREEQERTVSVRAHRDGDLGPSRISEFAENLKGQLYSAALTSPKTSQRLS
jgi:threonyl-tRNA synthetase